jgi:hypothetical protein
VAVAVAIGRAVVEETYTLSSSPGKRDHWTFTTLRSTKVAEDPSGARTAWDSQRREPGDPWPYVLQQAVAEVPVTVRFEAGRPTEVVGTEAWTASATAAILATGLPGRAAESGQSLVDPVGVVRDLARIFPGLPVEGRLVSADRIAGVEVVREEVCPPPEIGDTLRFRCVGTARAADGSNRLAEMETWTEVVADQDGLRWMESAWSGVVVTQGEAGAPRPVPVAGHRRAQRETGAAP